MEYRNCSINGNDTAQDLIDDYRATFYYNNVDVAVKKIFDSVDIFLDKVFGCNDMILTESNMYYFKKRNYILLGNVKTKLPKDYKHSFNHVSSVYFLINKPWYHPETEII